MNTQQFLDKIIDLCNLYKEHDYIINLPTSSQITLPVRTSTGEDPVALMLKMFEFNLKYGSLDYLIDQKQGYNWFPFIIAYRGSTVTVIYVNLVTKQFGEINIERETDYTPSHEGKFSILNINLYDEFVLPTKSYNYYGSYRLEVEELSDSDSE